MDIQEDNLTQKDIINIANAKIIELYEAKIIEYNKKIECLNKELKKILFRSNLEKVLNEMKMIKEKKLLKHINPNEIIKEKESEYIVECETEFLEALKTLPGGCDIKQVDMKLANFDISILKNSIITLESELTEIEKEFKEFKNSISL